MAQLILKKINGGLYAFNEHDSEKLSKIKEHEWVRCEIKKQRNGAFHNKYFSLLSYAFNNQDKYDVFEAFRAEVIMRAGYYEEHHHVTGQISFKPKSISFANMEEFEFRELYGRSIDVILNHFMVGSTEQEILNVVGYA